eukprot:COSAG04_NODE_4912_length_1828_cov_2.174089_4_plen_20_part_01
MIVPVQAFSFRSDRGQRKKY